MVRRRTAISLLLAVIVALVSVLGATPAVARWNIHNDADVTQITAPPGGTEDQTCPDRLSGLNGWSTFIPEGDDPLAFEPPAAAYGPGSYTVWKAPPGFADFSTAQAQFNDVGEIIGYNFVDASGEEIPATEVMQFVTADRTLLAQPVETDIEGVYVFTTAPIDVALPSSIAPGDVIGLLPPGGSEILVLTVIDCSPFAASGTVISAVKKRSFTDTVATFTGSGTSSDYTATIMWGDGTSSSVGTISSGPNGFLVTGTHTYQKKGSYPVTVTITQISTGSTVQALSTATVTSKR